MRKARRVTIMRAGAEDGEASRKVAGSRDPWRAGTTLIGLFIIPRSANGPVRFAVVLAFSRGPESHRTGLVAGSGGDGGAAIAWWSGGLPHLSGGSGRCRRWRADGFNAAARKPAKDHLLDFVP
jgi:hypothetical protein